MSVTKSNQGVFLNDENGNPVAVVLDGAVYRLEMQGKILDSSGEAVDPATSAQLDVLTGTVVADPDNAAGALLLTSPQQTALLAEILRRLRQLVGHMECVTGEIIEGDQDEN